MNNRQKKKFNKKLKCKTYAEYRLVKLIGKIQDLVWECDDDIPYVIVSNNGKHIKNLYLLKNCNCYPTSTSVSDGIEVRDELEISFSCKNVNDILPETATDKVGNIADMLKNGIAQCSTD